MTSSFQTTSETGVRERFRRLSAEWKEQSRYLSNTAQMAMLKPYQRIVGMGLSAAEENPVPPEAAGKVREMPGRGSTGGNGTGSRSMITRQDFPRVTEENQFILRVLPKMFKDQDMHEWM